MKFTLNPLNDDEFFACAAAVLGLVALASTLAFVGVCAGLWWWL